MENETALAPAMAGHSETDDDDVNNVVVVREVYL